MAVLLGGVDKVVRAHVSQVVVVVVVCVCVCGCVRMCVCVCVYIYRVCIYVMCVRECV